MYCILLIVDIIAMMCWIYSVGCRYNSNDVDLLYIVDCRYNIDVVDLQYIVDCGFVNLFLRLRAFHRIVHSEVLCSHLSLDLA